ncbi:hypothetical protein BSK59_13705 [Paenibacillus odorifer]|uniref:hypothetical protein n=1 Tax=Paenibacillus odorifer TaxID=189426 RepID=UPI00096EDC9C|nr:hypothetical protein [Paenibacillus odorifer]OME55526.1 hypothetical protein BSK59_13705 [Paenibacillus odorifer]
MSSAFNLVSTEIMNEYRGRNISFMKAIGFVEDFSDKGVHIEWLSDEENCLCGRSVYPNVDETLRQIKLI